ncbi:MFS transporter [Nocardiopsis salina]|uniref:MFS transporter n=1 Tax=Nocardiopsis salina TaxID=245836 RepID=UPI00034912F1|nr:MFS transporter [Nocardiopsis salina]
MPFALLALALGAFAIGTAEFVIMGLLPEAAADLDVTLSSAGHLIAAYALGVVIGAPILTAAATRLRRRTALLVFMGLFALGNVATVVAPTYETVLASRFLAGLPHGAFLGVGALVAAHMAGPMRRATAVARMLLGLTVANIVGVPAGTLLGQLMGWRTAFLVVAVIALVSLVCVMVFVPDVPSPKGVRLRGEIAAMGRPQVVYALITAVFGFAGVFAVYSYISPMMTEVAGMSPAGVPLVLALFGTGMTLGSLAVGPLADRWLRPTIYGSLASLAVVLVLFSVAVQHPVSAMIAVVVLGAVGFGVTAPLQVLIMNKAAGAPTIASSANHSAFNMANAGGAWIGGLGISAGLGYTSPALLGAGAAVLGLAVALTAGALDRRNPGLYKDDGTRADGGDAEAGAVEDPAVDASDRR